MPGYLTDETLTLHSSLHTYNKLITIYQITFEHLMKKFKNYLRCSQSPTVRWPIVLQLERFIVPNFILICSNVNTLFHRNIFIVQCGNKGSLWQWVLEGEKFVTGNCIRSRFEHCLWSNRGQIWTMTITQCQMATMILSTK